MNPLGFITSLARLLGLIEFLIAPPGKRPVLVQPGHPSAPPKAPIADLDPDVAAEIEAQKL